MLTGIAPMLLKKTNIHMGKWTHLPFVCYVIALDLFEFPWAQVLCFLGDIPICVFPLLHIEASFLNVTWVLVPIKKKYSFKKGADCQAKLNHQANSQVFIWSIFFQFTFSNLTFCSFSASKLSLMLFMLFSFSAITFLAIFKNKYDIVHAGK